MEVIWFKTQIIVNNVIVNNVGNANNNSLIYDWILGQTFTFFENILGTYTKKRSTWFANARAL